MNQRCIKRLAILCAAVLSSLDVWTQVELPEIQDRLSMFRGDSKQKLESKELGLWMTVNGDRTDAPYDSTLAHVHMSIN